jgi:hypothetical protein
VHLSLGLEFHFDEVLKTATGDATVAAAATAQNPRCFHPFFEGR